MPSPETTAVQAMMDASGHTEADANLIVSELKKAGWLLVQGTCAAASSPITDSAGKCNPISWKPLAQPFTDDLMDAVLHEMSDDDLDKIIVRPRDDHK